MEDASVSYLQHFDWRDEIRIYFHSYALSKKLGTPQNWQRALKLIVHRFEESVFSTEFMKTNLDSAVEILSANTIGARSEVIVFLAALNWLNYDYDSRNVHAVTLMKCVRFSSMTMEEILACYHPPLLTHVVEIPEVMMMLFRATCYVAAKSQDQEEWFREYASPKRTLTLHGLPVELWHRNIIPRSFASAHSEGVDSYRPSPDRKDYSRKFKTGPDISRILKEPVGALAGYGHSRKEDRTSSSPIRYRSQATEKKESSHAYGDFPSVMPPQLGRGGVERGRISTCTRYNGLLEPLPSSSDSAPSAAELLENFPEMDEEFEIEYERFVGKFTEIPSSKTRLKPHKDSFLRAMKDIHYVVPEETKIIHLSSGPQRFSSLLEARLEPRATSDLQEVKFSKKEPDKKKPCVPLEARLEPRAISDLQEEKFSKKELDIKKPYVQGKSIPKLKTSAPDDRRSLKYAKESCLKRDQVEKQKSESNHKMLLPSISDKKTRGKSERRGATYLFVVGGMNPLNSTKEMGEILVLDTTSNRWTCFEKLPESRHNHCAAYFDNCLYIVGGCKHEETMRSNRYTALRTCLKLDFKMMIWRQIARMECCRYDHGLAPHDGHLFAIGGQDGNGRLLKSVEVYDPKRNRWKFLPSSLCCGRKAMGVAVHSDRIWIAGGLIESGEDSTKLQAISHVDCYHPGERKWYFNLYSLPGPRCFCSLAVWAEKLYCVGGMVSSTEGAAKATDQVWFISKENEAWRAGPNLPDARMGGVAVVFKNSLHFLGGYDPDNDSSNGNISILTSDGTSWDTGPPLPFPLFGVSAVAVTVD